MTEAGAVMDVVFGAGEPVEIPGGEPPVADFCLGGRLGAPAGAPGLDVVPAPSCPAPPRPARRVRLCRAAAAACGGGSGCPQCVAEDVPAPAVDHGALDRFASVPVISLGKRLPLRPPEHDLCPPAATRRELTGLAEADARLLGAAPPAPARERFFPGRSARTVAFRCPYWQFPSLGAMPWVDPAPESIPCTSCDFESTSPATLYLDLVDPLFRDRRLAWPVLLVGDRAYALDWDPNRNPRVIVRDVEYQDGEAVLLAFTLDNGLTAVSPLLRVR